MKHVEVRAAVVEAQSRIAEKLEITTEKVLADLESARINAMATLEWGPAIRACELQGKHIGMFSDKVQHVGAGDGPISVEFIELRAVRPQ